MINFIDDVQWIYKQTDIRERPFFWRFRFIARACASYLNVAAWWELVRSNIAPLYRSCSLDFFQQPLRPFYCRAYTTSQRAKLLVDTYLFLAKELENSVYESLLNGESKLLAKVQGKNNAYDVILRVDKYFSREGVLVLHFMHGNEKIKSLAFSIKDVDGSKVCCVGCIQFGLRSADLAREIAADLYSAHPRYVLFYVLKKFCRLHGIDRIEGVAAENHIWKSVVYKHKKKIIGTDYDNLWMSWGGERLANGNFELPVDLEFKSIEAYKQKKRNLLLKKRKMLEEIQLSLD